LCGKEQPILTQFLKDSSDFGEDLAPSKIQQFLNIINLDPDTGKNEYVNKVWYLLQSGERMLYSYTIPHGAANGNYTLKIVTQIE
jgi:hypothetical protein